MRQISSIFPIILSLCLIQLLSALIVGPRLKNPLWRKGLTTIRMAAVVTEEQLKLTKNLQEYVQKIRSIADDRLKYQQLLYYASTADPMPAEYKTPENKVIGCLSTVHVHSYMNDEGKVFYYGDSDSILTKGLVTILAKGLSGNTVEDIMKVNPEFIGYAGFSLTSGRNNGFLNMLVHMKKQASALANKKEKGHESEVKTPSPNKTGLVQERIEKKLQLLKPSVLEIENESYKHANHAGMEGKPSNGESHFKLKVVAECFEGVTLVNRHKLIYTLLADELRNSIHALSIDAKTPKEIAASL